MTFHSATGPEFAGAARVLLQRAELVLAVHHAGVDGWCAGCASDGHLLFHPCSYVAWARDVVRQYGSTAPLAR